MLPGGISALADDLEVLRIKSLIIKIKKWYEKEILNASIEEFQEIDSLEKLLNFINTHPNSQVAIFYNILKEANLFDKGISGYGFINFGSLDKEDGFFTKRGVYKNNEIKELDISKITEDVTYSWYDGKEENPFKEKTKPNINKVDAYSFAKAPRYEGEVYQTGPLGEELVNGNKLFIELFNKYKDSVFVREFARLVRGVRFIPIMLNEINKIIKNIKEPLYIKPRKKSHAKGIGLTHAARGALGHWIQIKKGKIASYQIISPTTWNGSAMDKNNQKGPWEKALIGTEIKDIQNPVEMGHIIRSFDPCLVCTVHFLDTSLRLKV
jgi:hydrogenase large subunit